MRLKWVIEDWKENKRLSSACEEIYSSLYEDENYKLKDLSHKKFSKNHKEEKKTSFSVKVREVCKMWKIYCMICKYNLVVYSEFRL